MGSKERIVDSGHSKADHLCVLVHGLWGNPSHLQYLATALREKHSEDRLHILIPETNAGNYTYDGIELGGERVTHEIEVFLNEAKDAGTTVTKISIVGYSLGGLVARYAVGLLDSRGWFDKLKPINFTTFATPHLGVRTPIVGMQSHVWNFLGSHTLSVSGQQLFTTDSFRDTGRPLLSVLADPSSVFMVALAKFKNRVIYANIINDRSVPYYTASMCDTDPFTDLSALKINYMSKYSPTVLDPAKPVSPKGNHAEPPFLTRIADSTSEVLQNVPMAALFAVLIPIFTIPFFVNAGIQSVRSQQRIKLHEEGKSGISLASYRIPIIAENVRDKMDGAIENLTPAMRTRSGGKEQANLLESDPTLTSNRHATSSDPDSVSHSLSPSPSPSSTPSTSLSDPLYYKSTLKQLPTSLSARLNLSPEQKSMIASLDNLGFRKIRVHITKARHSHAAIIVRILSRKSFSEGKVVVRHWLEEEFEI